jgi:hypothetical protein
LILTRLVAVVVALAALTGPALAGPARAGDTVGVEILQYGLFRSDIVGKQPDVSGVAHNVVDNICHVATTRDVPMKIGVHFGVRYKVTGPVAAERALLKKVMLYPVVMKPPPPGRPISQVSNFVELRVGASSYAEYALEHAWELVAGTWTFQFFERDRKLAELSFTVSEDAAAGESIEPTCFRLSS